MLGHSHITIEVIVYFIFKALHILYGYWHSLSIIGLIEFIDGVRDIYQPFFPLAL
jgi:hypothetical protein